MSLHIHKHTYIYDVYVCMMYMYVEIEIHLGEKLNTCKGYILSNQEKNVRGTDVATSTTSPLQGCGC